MSDKPTKANDAPIEKERQVDGGLSLANADPQHAVGKIERERKSTDFEGLSDEFGHKIFASPQIVGEHGAGKVDYRKERIEQTGQRRGSEDTDALAMIQTISEARTPDDLAKQIDRFDQVAQFGEQRADRFANVLHKRSGDESQEQAIKEQIESIRYDKEASQRSLVQKSQEEEADGPAGAKGDKRAGKQKDKDSKLDPLAEMAFAFQGDIRKHGERVSKDFADWADARVLAGMLGNEHNAARAINDLVQKAQMGNASARDFLAGTLASDSAEATWLAARRGDVDAGRRPVAVPNLAQGMSLEIKTEAARGLISLADVAGGLSQSENLALAIAMGQAFENKRAGDTTTANNELLDATTRHFQKMLSINPQSARSQQENDRLAGMLHNAVWGLTDGLHARIPGADRVGEFIDRAAASLSATAEIAAAREKQQKEREVKKAGNKYVANAGSAALRALWNNPEALTDLLSGRTKDARKHTRSQSDPESTSGIRGNNSGLHRAGSRSSKGDPVDSHGEMRATFKVGERNNLVKLDSGRVYDRASNRFFVRSGDTFVEDSKPGTDSERSQIADLGKKQESASAEVLKQTNVVTNTLPAQIHVTVAN